MKTKFMKQKTLKNERMITLPKSFAYKVMKSVTNVKIKKSFVKGDNKETTETRVIMDYNDELCILSANIDCRHKYGDVIQTFINHVGKDGKNLAGGIVVPKEEPKETNALLIVSAKDACDNSVESPVTHTDLLTGLSISNTYNIANAGVKFTDFRCGLFFFHGKIFFKYRSFCREVHSLISFTNFVKTNESALKNLKDKSSRSIGQIIIYPLEFLDEIYKNRS